MAAIAFFPFEFTPVPGVACAFTSRRGGVSEPPHDSANLSFEVGDDDHAVRENRRLIFDRLELNGWCECKQVHGDEMHFNPVAKQPEDKTRLVGDGLATSTPGVALVIKTADCQPVLLAHRSGKHIAALHVGWRGNKMKFPITGVTRFCKQYDLDPGDIFAVRGPSLSPKASEFVNFDTDFGPGFQKYLNSEAMTMDLWALTRDQLIKAGLPDDQIFGMDLCTMSDDDTFFSYRKMCASSETSTGRQTGIIWIKPEAA